MGHEELVAAVRQELGRRDRTAARAVRQWRGGGTVATWHTGKQGLLYEGRYGIGELYNDGIASHIASNDPSSVLSLTSSIREVVDAYERAVQAQEQNSRDFAAEAHAPAYSADPLRLARLRGQADALQHAVELLAHGLGINTEEAKHG